MINENRRLEIMNRLKSEREQRMRLIQEGDLETIHIDRSLIQTPSIGNCESLSQTSENISVSNQTPQILEQQKQKLQAIRNDLFKKKQEFTYIDKLAEPKSIIQEEREHQRLENEKKMLAQLPFKPQLNDQSNLLAEIKYTKFDGIPVQDRLLLLEKERINHIEELKLMVDQQENEEQPLKAPKPYSDTPPLYERYQQVMQEKKANLAYLKAKQLKNEEDLYRPKISQQSHILAEIRNNGQNVIERLVEDGIRKQNVMYSEDVPFNFQPQINAYINQQIVKGDFQERQDEFIKKQLENQIELENKAFEDYTFQPIINKNSTKLVAARKGSTEDSLFDKLYNDHQTKQSILEERKMEEIKKLNFNPELNQKSMKMAIDRTFTDLVKNEYGDYRKQLLKEKYEDSDKECSFYPSVSTSMKYSQMHSQYSFDDCHEKIKQQQSEKEERLTQLKQQKEQETLKECTFKPQINKKNIDNTKKVEVYGLETFMLKVDMQNKIKNSQEQVEQKLFKKHEQYDIQKHQEKTEQKPFNLSNNRGAKNSYKK